MADRTNKATGIKVISQVGRDPEANRYKRVKEEEERLRSEMRRDSKIKRVKERAINSRLSSGYLEGGDSEEEGVSLAAIKNKYKKGGKSRKQAYSSGDDEDDSDIETKKAKKLELAKNALKDSDDESEGSARSRSPARRSRSRSGSGSDRSGSGSAKSGSGKSDDSD